MHAALERAPMRRYEAARREASARASARLDRNLHTLCRLRAAPLSDQEAEVKQEEVATMGRRSDRCERLAERGTAMRDVRIYSQDRKAAAEAQGLRGARYHSLSCIVARGWACLVAAGAPFAAAWTLIILGVCNGDDRARCR